MTTITGTYPICAENEAGLIYSFPTAKGPFYMLVLKGNRGLFVQSELPAAKRMLQAYTAARTYAP